MLWCESIIKAVITGNTGRGARKDELLAGKSTVAARPSRTLEEVADERLWEVT